MKTYLAIIVKLEDIRQLWVEVTHAGLCWRGYSGIPYGLLKKK